MLCAVPPGARPGLQGRYDQHMQLEDMRGVTASRAWGGLARELVAAGKPLPDLEAFDTYWIEAGHRIREQVADDALLLKMLRLQLPAYAGPRVILYRGENLARLRSGALGFSWSQDREVASMFGRGLNGVHGGGVLLRGTFEASAVVSGPNAHSGYLGEDQFTVDPYAATVIEQIEVFPAVR